MVEIQKLVGGQDVSGEIYLAGVKHEHLMNLNGPALGVVVAYLFRRYRDGQGT